MRRHEQNRSLLPATILAVLAACTGGGSGDEPKGRSSTAPAEVATGPVRGDWMVRWLLADPESLNPITSNDSASSSVLESVFSTLTTLDPATLEMVPVLAKAPPVVAEDHLTYTFEIRDDATFSDGKPVTTADVLFSLLVAKHPKVHAPHLRNYLQSVADAEILDGNRVRFRCSEPYFRNDLVLGSITILPRHFYDPEGGLEGIGVAELDAWDELDPAKRARAEGFAERFNRDFHRVVLGSGAFVLADPSRDLVTGERITLRHRDDFWAPGDTLRGDAWVDRMVFRVINNPDAALVTLKARELDLMGLTPLQHRRQTSSPGFESAFAKEESYAPGYSYVGWNGRRPVFADRAVRRALAHFVDRDRIIDKVLFGLGEKVDSPIYKFRAEYAQDLVGYPFDPARGKAILDEAGWIDRDGDGVREKTIDGVVTPLRFEIVSNSGNPVRKNVGLILIDEMKRAGVGATFRELDWSILLERVKTFEYDAVILGWAMSVTPPDLYQVWHSSQAVENGSNHVAFENPRVDAILDEYRGSFDPERRVVLYRDLQQILHDEAPYAFLFIQKSISAYDRRFRNTKWYPTGGPLLGEWWVPQPEQRYQP